MILRRMSMAAKYDLETDFIVDGTIIFINPEMAHQLAVTDWIE
jgi:hypothetical protein